MSKIEWTEQTWNPTRGCRRKSPGCENCYAERQAIRHAGPGGHYEGLVRITPNGPRWTGEARFVPAKLDEPLRRRKPTTYFVDSMSDLFFEAFTDEQIAAIFGVMAACPQHTFQVLTKRPERMQRWFEWIGGQGHELREAVGEEPPAGCRPEASACSLFLRQVLLDSDAVNIAERPWPLPNVWIGVSVEDQQRADERIPLLLQTPAAVRFLSCEPLLGSVDLAEAVNKLDWLDPANFKPGGLDWVIVGGESGPGARSCELAWIRDIVRQCAEAGVPCFVKQLGSNPIGNGYDVRPVQVLRGGPEPGVRLDLRDRKGGNMEEWPADLRVREMPGVRR